jgi:chromosome partitioning protein
MRGKSDKKTKGIAVDTSMRLNVPGHRDLKKIVVLNPKGGCGKSTLAVNLSGYLASRGNQVAIMDFDPQGSSMRWLKLRPGNVPPIHGIAGYDVDASATRSWQLRVPPHIRYLVVDSPGSVPPEKLSELTSGAHAILIPVLPSDIDVHAATQLMTNLLLVAKVSRRMGRIVIVSNRVRENTLAYRKLVKFLGSLAISAIGVLKDSQNYIHSVERGLAIHELPPNAKIRADVERWQPIFDWLEERLEIPLTPRDFHRPLEGSNSVTQLTMSLDVENSSG